MEVLTLSRRSLGEGRNICLQVLCKTICLTGEPIIMVSER